MSYFPVVGIAGFVFLDVHPDWFFTFGGSAPQALWRVVDRDSDTPLAKGDWIIVCPPLSAAEHRQLFVDEPLGDGDCTSRRSLKQVAAVPNDRVVVDGPVVYTPFATVEAVSIDSNGEPLPRPLNGEHVVAQDTYWVLSRHPRSIDSRYYGSVPTANVEKRVKPLWTMP